VFAVVAAVVWGTLGRPVFYRQRRTGWLGRPFTLVKFRTMKDVPGEGASDEARMTPFGRFMRSLSIDELPQLWNVLRGDMSLIGPRPLPVAYRDRYTEVQDRRHNVRPGITGLAQVRGRNLLSWEERFKLDVWYVENMSLLLDLQILGMTVLQVLKREGISACGHATMPPFMGSDASQRLVQSGRVGHLPGIGCRPSGEDQA
jgi:lipopolysaccharide/colanic/teichoic acid biosynthesis glycosyltransferase